MTNLTLWGYGLQSPISTIVVPWLYANFSSLTSHAIWSWARSNLPSIRISKTCFALLPFPMAKSFQLTFLYQTNQYLLLSNLISDSFISYCLSSCFPYYYFNAFYFYNQNFVRCNASLSIPYGAISIITALSIISRWNLTIVEI